LTTGRPLGAWEIWDISLAPRFKQEANVSKMKYSRKT